MYFVRLTWKSHIQTPVEEILIRSRNSGSSRFESDVNSDLMARLNYEKDFELNRATEFQRVQQPKIPSEAENYGKSMENIKHVGEFTEVHYK